MIRGSFVSRHLMRNIDQEAVKNQESVRAQLFHFDI